MFKKIIDFFNSKQVTVYDEKEEYGLYQEIDDDLGVEVDKNLIQDELEDDYEDISIDDEYPM
ncbi:hypothetical protein [Sutcliffiella cohnii]|uniref:hypothetical protein n=1 Tax=Sutcliffiella cohnii TaxID=33932 RepID=UPI002E238CDB|nr:hypothetical protein [Sutcliffiella cohnii]